MLIANKHLGLMVGIGLGLGLAAASHASIIATDPDAMTGFKGSEVFSSTGGGNILGVVVDYAVFAPGKYPGSSLGGSDPSGGADYVYTYLINNDPTPASTVSLTSFSVGLASGSGAHNAGVNNSLGGITPFAQVITSSSFQHLYSPSIDPGNSSNITLFTSPNAPTFGNASVGNGGLSDQEQLPTPTAPEPASLGLLASAGLLVLGRRRRQV